MAKFHIPQMSWDQVFKVKARAQNILLTVCVSVCSMGATEKGKTVSLICRDIGIINPWLSNGD